MSEIDYQWGVVFVGRELGWIPCEDRWEAEREVRYVEDKYAPAYLARRALGPIEKVEC